jgi:hypothetical protein
MARVNLPHIGNKICLIFFSTMIFLTFKVLPFSVEICIYICTLRISNFINLSMQFLDPKVVTKNAVGFFLRCNLLNNTQVQTFLRENLYRRYPWDVKFQNFKYFFWFLKPNIVIKNAVRFVLW